MTMAAAYLASGMQDQTATFSLFVRDLPATRGYLVAGGLEAVLDHLDGLRFGDTDLAAIRRLGLFDEAFLDHLRQIRFEGTVRAVPEGRLVFAGEPLLEVEGPIIVTQLVESYLLNQVTTQTTLSTKAARMRQAADGRAVVDFALRRCQGTDAAMKLVRAVAITGLAATSNVAGATAYGVAASGTMAHSFVQAHPDELEAFRVFAALYGEDTRAAGRHLRTPTAASRRPSRSPGRSASATAPRSVASASTPATWPSSPATPDACSTRRASRSRRSSSAAASTSTRSPSWSPSVRRSTGTASGHPSGCRPTSRCSTASTSWSRSTVEACASGRRGRRPGPERSRCGRAADATHDVLATATEPAPERSASALLGCGRARRRPYGRSASIWAAGGDARPGAGVVRARLAAPALRHPRPDRAQAADGGPERVRCGR